MSYPKYYENDDATVFKPPTLIIRQKSSLTTTHPMSEDFKLFNLCVGSK